MPQQNEQQQGHLNQPNLAFPWEHDIAAAAQEGHILKMPADLPYNEQPAWQALSHLYARFSLKKIDRETASSEKKLIKHAAAERRRLDDADRKFVQHCIAVTHKTEIYRAAFRKAQTEQEALDAAKKLVEAIENIPVIDVPAAESDDQ